MTKRITTVFLIWIAAAATAAAATTIPLDLSTGRPVVEVTIAGGQPLRMVLDTGAGGSVVDAGLAAGLGLETVGRQRIGDPSGRRAHDVDRVALPDVRLGGVALGDLEAAALDLPRAPGHERRPFDGVLSVRALAGHLATFDLAAGQLTLEPGGALDPDDEHVVPYYLDDMGIPWVHAAVGPLTVRAFLDTGSPGEISMAKALAKQLDLAEEPKVVGTARTVSGSFEIEAAPLAGEIVVAGHSIPGPTVVLDGLHRGTQGNLGTGFLRRFVVTLDQSNHLVRFAPHGNPALRSDDLPQHRRPAAPASRTAGDP